MIKKHKWKAIISSIVILLPILFGLFMWELLPVNMVSHWGADGVADDSAPKGFMVFGLPLILLALQWLMLLLQSLEEKKKPQNDKIVTLYFVIIPALSLAVNFVVYSVALEKEWNLVSLLPVLIGGVFMYIGNLLPKTTRNRTMGIKLRWTMGNDENWRKTHRLGGLLWFWSGLVIMASALLPMGIGIWVMFAAILLCVGVPTVYSRAIYKKHKEQGVEYEPVFHQKSDKVAIWITSIFVPLVLVLVAILMFVGDVTVSYTETAFTVSATFSDPVTTAYESVDSVEYRESFDAGTREMGFGSLRLSIGTFQNEEFGRYTIYAYTNGEGAVVLKKGDKVLVIVGKTAEETKAIYETIAAKVQ